MRKVCFVLNGREVEFEVEPGMTLLELLRREGLKSVKHGCESGECGACTVLLDGEPVNSCILLALQVRGRRIDTVESLGTPQKLHPLQEAFLECGAVQCGYCTPGMLLSAKALLDRSPDPTKEEIRDALAGNFCRCTGYVKPIEAVRRAADMVRDERERGGE